MPALRSQLSLNVDLLKQIGNVLLFNTETNRGESTELPDHLVQILVDHRFSSYIDFYSNQEDTKHITSDKQRELFHTKALRESATYLLHQNQLSQFIGASNSQSLTPLVIKGLAVGHTIYPHPSCRPTSDLDIVIPMDQYQETSELLIALGYRKIIPSKGQLYSGAEDWVKELTHNGTQYHIDLHWDITHRMFYRNRITFEQLFEDSLTISSGSFDYRIPSNINSLIIACVHLAAMKEGSPIVFIWLLDIYLLLLKLSSDETSIFFDRCKQWNVSEPCEVFCKLAVHLGPTEELNRLINQLSSQSSEYRKWLYDQTLNYRLVDLFLYFGRLKGFSKKTQLIKEFLQHSLQR